MDRSPHARRQARPEWDLVRRHHHAARTAAARRKNKLRRRHGASPGSIPERLIFGLMLPSGLRNAHPLASPGCIVIDLKPFTIEFLQTPAPAASIMLIDGSEKHFLVVCPVRWCRAGPLRRASRRGSRWQPEAIENLSDWLRRMNRCDYPHPALAPVTFENVQLENSFHQFRPTIIA